MPKGRQHYICNMSSRILDCPAKSSVTMTQDSHQSSHASSANWWALNRKFPWHTIPGPMDIPSEQINGSRLSFRFVTNYKQDDWVWWLPMVQFAHNNWPSDTTRKSPFFLLMGYNPCADWKNATSPLPQVTLHVNQFKEAHAQAQNLMIKAQQSWVKHWDMPKYKEGDLVWL